MALHLVRHASAGSRSQWHGDDLERPLDERGHEQRAAIAAHLQDAPVRAVLSSLATRCVQTVEPLAETHGLQVVIRRELTEGARAADMLDLLREQAAAPGDVVFCSHGDLIPETLNRLLREGLEMRGPRGCQKGSVWTLETEAGAIARAAYSALS